MFYEGKNLIVTPTWKLYLLKFASENNLSSRSPLNRTFHTQKRQKEEEGKHIETRWNENGSKIEFQKEKMDSSREGRKHKRRIGAFANIIAHQNTWKFHTHSTCSFQSLGSHESSRNGNYIWDGANIDEWRSIPGLWMKMVYRWEKRDREDEKYPLCRSRDL